MVCCLLLDPLDQVSLFSVTPCASLKHGMDEQCLVDRADSAGPPGYSAPSPAHLLPAHEQKLGSVMNGEVVSQGGDIS